MAKRRQPADRGPSFQVKLADLSVRYGLEYEGGDDLDRYYLAAVELASGEQAWISKHDSDPTPGTVIHLDAASDIWEAQSLLLDAFGLDREALLWAAPVPHVPKRDERQLPSLPSR